jgi:16S rRNA G1207 methylase RsmC
MLKNLIKNKIIKRPKLGYKKKHNNKKKKLQVTIVNKEGIFSCANIDKVGKLLEEKYPDFKIEIIYWEKKYNRFGKEIKKLLETDIFIGPDGTIVNNGFFLRPGTVFISLGRYF